MPEVEPDRRGLVGLRELPPHREGLTRLDAGRRHRDRGHHRRTVVLVGPAERHVERSEVEAVLGAPRGGAVASVLDAGGEGGVVQRQRVQGVEAVADPVRKGQSHGPGQGRRLRGGLVLLADRVGEDGDHLPQRPI